MYTDNYQYCKYLWRIFIRRFFLQVYFILSLFVLNKLLKILVNILTISLYAHNNDYLSFLYAAGKDVELV